MSESGSKDGAQSVAFGAVCSADVSGSDGTCLVPPCQTLGTLRHFLQEEFTTHVVCEFHEVLASPNEGGDVMDEGAWEFGKGCLPLLFHLVFNMPANLRRWRGGGYEKGEIDEEGSVV